jgi:hypothetical protein
MAVGAEATTTRPSDSSATASTIEELKCRWEASGTSLRPGVSERQIGAFERRYRAKLPDDLAEYFRCVDGMNEGETDERLMRFWRLDELRPIREITPALCMPYDGFFCFADCPLGTYDDPLGTRSYAIRLLAGVAHVIIVHRSAVSCVADSFSQFLESYLAVRSECSTSGQLPSTAIVPSSEPPARYALPRVVDAAPAPSSPLALGRRN